MARHQLAKSMSLVSTKSKWFLLYLGAAFSLCQLANLALVAPRHPSRVRPTSVNMFPTVLLPKRADRVIECLAALFLLFHFHVATSKSSFLLSNSED
jgi:hypothetical protein